jgi:hypothetical protein
VALAHVQGLPYHKLRDAARPNNVRLLLTSTNHLHVSTGTGTMSRTWKDVSGRWSVGQPGTITRTSTTDADLAGVVMQFADAIREADANGAAKWLQVPLAPLFHAVLQTKPRASISYEL